MEFSCTSTSGDVEQLQKFIQNAVNFLNFYRDIVDAYVSVSLVFFLLQITSDHWGLSLLLENGERGVCLAILNNHCTHAPVIKLLHAVYKVANTNVAK